MNNYAKFAGKLILTSISGLFISIILIYFLYPSPKYDIFHMIQIKHQLITTTSSPKIIIIGGSNAMMGIDSQMINDRLKFPVVNFGFHAGIPLDFYINETLPYIKKGDIVLLELEYGYYYGLKGDEQSIARLFEVYPLAMISLLKDNYYRYPVLLKILFQTKYIRFRDKWVNYDIDAMTNKWGDSLSMVNYHGDEVKTVNLVGYTFPDVSSINKINYYLDRIAKKGAKAYLLFPSVDYNSFYTCGNCIDSFLYPYLLDHINTEIIGLPSEYTFTKEYLADTVYHLNGVGRRIRTEKMIEDLIKAGIFVKP